GGTRQQRPADRGAGPDLPGGGAAAGLGPPCGRHDTGATARRLHLERAAAHRPGTGRDRRRCQDPDCCRVARGGRHGRHATRHGLGDAQPRARPASTVRHPRAGGGSGMNHRLTVTAAVATVLASVALYSLISRTGWFWAGLGAVIVTAAVGTLTRLRTLPVIVCYLAVLAG